MLFVGIDLAWSTKNGTGVAVIGGNRQGGDLLSYATVYSDSEIVDYISKNVGDENALIAIDAPLIVPNQKGRRIAEEVVGDLFRKYDAGAHPANRERLGSWSGGKIRGEELAKLLEEIGYKHDPYLKRYEESRKFFEVYPHPSMVTLFGLDRILQYKAKPHRDYEFRWAAFREYQQHLGDLAYGSPALNLPKEITGRRLEDLRAQGLKDYEDILDGIFCSYIAYYSWANPDKCAVLGTMQGGYILTPILDSMRSKIGVREKQSKLKN